MKHTYLVIAALALALFASGKTFAKTEPTFTLVLDAGHGGKDPGAVNGKTQEKNINLDVVLKVGKKIEETYPQIKVIYTRKTDIFLELYKRADIANKAEADLFVSIHTNSAKSAAAYGAETYLLGVEENRTSANLNVAIEENKAILYESDYESHYEGYDPNSPESQIIFEFMQSEYQKESLKVADMVQKRLTSKGAGRHDRGVHQAGYLVLWKSAMPSILIELGFISNANEMKYMTSQQGINTLSDNIFNALTEYASGVIDITATNSSTLKNAIQENITNTDKTASSDPAGPVYKIQFMTTASKIPTNDKRLKGLDNVEYTQDGKLYKYTTGRWSTYAEASKGLQNVRKQYHDAFIIATLDGQKLGLNEARKMTGE